MHRLRVQSSISEDDMRDHLNKDSLSRPARRHFLHVVSAVAGVAAASSLPSSASAAGNGNGNGNGNGGGNGGATGTAGCLLKGTHILTRQGLKRVETLSIGDHVMTARGETIPIRWIGRQIFRRGASARWPDSVHPICVARSALADNVPHANLYL